MNRRQFIKNAAIASTAIAGGTSWASCPSSNNPQEKNIRWAMGWILWRDFADRQIPLSEAIQNLSDLGLDGIEFSPRKDELSKHGFTRESFRDLLADRNLSVSGNYFGGTLYDASQRSNVLSAFESTLNNLKFYGAKNVIIGPPARVEGDNNELIKVSTPLLNELGRIANSEGIQLGLHPHVNTIVETPDEIDLVMELTDPAYVLMAPDAGHIKLGGGNEVEIIRKYSNRLSYFHLKDAAGAFNRPDFGPNMRELGKGEVDYRGIMSILKEINYSGWLNVEQDKTFMTPSESAAESMRYITATLKPIYA